MWGARGVSIQAAGEEVSRRKQNNEDEHTKFNEGSKRYNSSPILVRKEGELQHFRKWYANTTFHANTTCVARRLQSAGPCAFSARV